MLGHGRLRALCEDGVTRLCSIRGTLKKRKGSNLISSGDIILISKRPHNNTLADVLHKYSNSDKQAFIKNDILVSQMFKDEILGIENSSNDVVFNNNFCYEESDIINYIIHISIFNLKCYNHQCPWRLSHHPSRNRCCV